MSLRIQNHGGSSQTRGLWFTLPIARADTLGQHIDLSSGEVAHRVHEDARKALYSVTGTWPTSNTTVTLSASAYSTEDEFQLHPAYGTADCGTVTSWDMRFVPRVYKRVGGVETEIFPNIRQQPVVLRMDSPYMKEITTTFHYNGWHFEQSLRIWSGEALGEIVTSIYWSDETATTWSTPMDALVFRYGHEVLGQFWVHTNEKWVQTDNNYGVTLNFNFASSGASDPGNTRQAWNNLMWHGRMLTFRGHIFGRGSTVVSGDEAIFAACDTLRAHGNGTEWQGGWGFSGRVPDVPANSTNANAASLRAPAYATTTKHYVTWDRGTSHDDTHDNFGMVSAIRSGATSQGGLGMVFATQILHGYMNVWDAEVATGDWTLRPRWVYRDGTFPVLVVARNSFFTRNGYPWFINGIINNGVGSTGFGRSAASGMLLPADSGGEPDHPDDQHTSAGWAWYYMFSFDYITSILIEHEAHYWAVNGNRSDPYTNRQAALPAGNRSMGRSVNSLLQMAKMAPQHDPVIREALYGFSGWANQFITHMLYQTNPPTTTSSLGTNFIMFNGGSVSNPPTYNGQAFGVGNDPEFQMIGTIGLWQSWLETGNPAFKDAYEKIASSTLLFCSVYLAASYTGYGYEGWWLPYNLYGSISGEPLPDSIRTSTHTRFTEFCTSAGGIALRQWGYGGVWLYTQPGVGQNAAAIARANLILNTMRLGNAAEQSWGQVNRAAAAV